MVLIILFTPENMLKQNKDISNRNITTMYIQAKLGLRFALGLTNSLYSISFRKYASTKYFAFLIVKCSFTEAFRYILKVLIKYEGLC